jgi:hypothetical protein
MIWRLSYMLIDPLVENLNNVADLIIEFMKAHITGANIPFEEWERRVIAEIRHCAQTFESVDEREDFIRKQDAIWSKMTNSYMYKMYRDEGANCYARLCATYMFDSLMLTYTRTPELAKKYIASTMKKKLD